MPTLTINTIYKEGQDTTVISSTAPTGAVGFEKDTGQTGFFVYSESPYTLWLKNSSGVWSSHQTFTAGNLLVSSTFAWGEYEAAYLQTAVSDHIAYVYPRTGAILIDGDTSDGVNQADTLLTAGSNTGIGVTTAPIEQFPNWTNSNGHILPDTNATYDIGSAEKKVRHLFLSDNSLWVGDSNKITISNGKIKTTKRKKETPQYILDAGATPQDFMDFYPARTAASLTVQEWVDFGRAFVGDPTITAAKMYGSSDFSEDADWEDYLVVDSPTSGDLTLSGTTGQAASLTEIRDAIDNKYLFDCAGATVYYDGVPYPRDVHLRDTSVQFWNEDSSQRGASIALNLNPGQQAQDLWISMMHIENQPRKIYLDAGPGGTIASTYHAPGEVEVRGTLSLNTETLSVTDVAQSLTDNTAAIAANVTDIAAIDTSGIATNAAAIAAIDTSGIATNTAAIAANATDIAAIDTFGIATNAAAIAANVTDIAAIDTFGIATNAAAIAANVTDIAAIDTSGIATNAAAIAAIDMGVTTSFTDSAGNANFSIEPTGNPDAGVRYLKVGADTTPGHDYSDRDSVLHLVGGLPEYNSGMVMLQGRVAIRDKNLNVQLTDVATSIVDNTSNIATNTIDITSNSKNFLLLPYNVAHDGEANTENHQFLLASGGTLFGQSTDISLITDNGGGLFINAPAGEAFLRVDGKKLSVKDTVNLLELIKAATDQANDFAHFQALMGLAFANWDPNV